METLFTGCETETEKVKSITKMINDTLYKCDSDIIMTLKNNIVVGGGNSMPEGFKERLRNKIEGCVIECEP